MLVLLCLRLVAIHALGWLTYYVCILCYLLTYFLAQLRPGDVQEMLKY